MSRAEFADELMAEMATAANSVVARLVSGAAHREAVETVSQLLGDVAVAVEFACPGIVDRGLAWFKVRARTLRFDMQAVGQLPEWITAAFDKVSPPAQQALHQVLRGGETYLRHLPDRIEPAPGDAMRDERVDRLVEALLGNDRLAARSIVLSGGSASQQLHEVVEPAMRAIGVRWQHGGLPAALEHVASRIVDELVGVLRARCVCSSTGPEVLLVRPLGDEHALAQTCLQVHLLEQGFRARFLPAWEERDDWLAVVAATPPAATLISCSTPMHLRATAKMVRELRSERGLSDGVVMVGGALIGDVPQLMSMLGADHSAASGKEAAEGLRHLLGASAG